MRGKNIVHYNFKAMDNVKILDINLNRYYFLQLGLYINTVGKARVAEMILMDKTRNIPIILDWKGNPKDEWPKSTKSSPHQRLC